ncbi:MAG: outer membrane lipoprotein chaperone LolA [Steroidobacteraceae bacterium]|jgi:outer membrane lipoprotein carrier protein|nr:outer membrane lipoprotein chaperone LolA [Steroidobacteraceae bacterium]
MFTRLLRPLAAVLPLTLLATPVVAASSAEQRLDRYLSGVSTLRAEFVQEVSDADGRVRERASGTLTLQKPGRFRWDYREPAGQLLVSDGATLWLYDEELEQVTVRPVSQTLSTTPAMLLTGQGRVGEAFVVEDDSDSDGLDWIALTPRRQDTDFRRVRLALRGGELVRMELTDRLGQVTAIDFSGIQRNPPVPASLFRFEPPPGVDVVGAAAP